MDLWTQARQKLKPVSRRLSSEHRYKRDVDKATAEAAEAAEAAKTAEAGTTAELKVMTHSDPKTSPSQKVGQTSSNNDDISTSRNSMLESTMKATTPSSFTYKDTPPTKKDSNNVKDSKETPSISIGTVRSSSLSPTTTPKKLLTENQRQSLRNQRRVSMITSLNKINDLLRVGALTEKRHSQLKTKLVENTPIETTTPLDIRTSQIEEEIKQIEVNYRRKKTEQQNEHMDAALDEEEESDDDDHNCLNFPVPPPPSATPPPHLITQTKSWPRDPSLIRKSSEMKRSASLLDDMRDSGFQLDDDDDDSKQDSLDISHDDNINDDTVIAEANDDNFHEMMQSSIVKGASSLPPPPPSSSPPPHLLQNKKNQNKIKISNNNSNNTKMQSLPVGEGSSVINATVTPSTPLVSPLIRSSSVDGRGGDSRNSIKTSISMGGIVEEEDEDEQQHHRHSSMADSLSSNNQSTVDEITPDNSSGDHLTHSTRLSQVDLIKRANIALEEERRRERVEKYKKKIQYLHASGVISEYTLVKLNKQVLSNDKFALKMIDEKMIVLSQIATVKSRIADSAANHEGYLYKLPQAIVPAGKTKKNGLSKRSTKDLKQKGVWKRRFFALKPESCQLVYFESHKGSVFNASSSSGSSSSSSSDALGEMDLDNGFHFVDVVTRSDKPKECTLVLGTRMLSLKAETDVEMDMWLEAFAAIKTQWKNRMHEQRRKKEKEKEKGKNVDIITTAKDHEDKNKIKIRKGVLVKRGDFRRTWKARYFILNEIGLAYYAKQDDATPKRLIEYRSISGHPGVKLSWIRKNALKIHVIGDGYGGSSTKSSNNRTYYMFARSALERDSWIDDISHNIDIDRKRNIDRGTMARVDDTVGQKGRVLAAQLYAQSKKKQRRKSAVGHTNLLMANSTFLKYIFLKKLLFFFFQ